LLRDREREKWESKGSSPLGSIGRETYSMIDRHVSWVDEDIYELWRTDVSRECDTSMEDTFASTVFSIVTEEESR
jgi:hypothetical protein